MPTLGDEILEIRSRLKARFFARLDDGVQSGRNVGAVDAFAPGEVFSAQDHVPKGSFRIVVRKRQR